MYMQLLAPRQNPLDEARNTLSSWDNCMAKSYCKWPVIVAIVVGSLILFSVIFCIARCICCGAEVACCCFKCCSCCCSGSGRSGHKRMKSDGPPAPYYPNNPHSRAYGHQAQVAPQPEPVQYQSTMPTFTPAPMPMRAPVPDKPQYATFSSPTKPVNEDALPQMPTWKDGRDVHVEVEDQPMPEKRGDMEMDRLNYNGSVNSGSMGGVAAAGAIGARRSPGPGRSPIQRSPSDERDMYNSHPGGYQDDGFVGAGPQRGSPYAQDDYRRGSPGPNRGPEYGAGDAYGAGQQYGRRSPGHAQEYNQYAPQNDHYDDHYDNYNQAPPPANDRYNTPAPLPVHDRYNSPAPPPAHDRYNSPAPAPIHDRYNSPAPPPAGPIEMPSYNNYSPPPAPAPAPASSSPVYPGQKTYQPEAGYPGQQSYQAFNPTGGSNAGQYSGVTRKPMDGTYREL